MKTISMTDLHSTFSKLGPNLGKDEVILDVRSPEEFREGHIPGSRNIPHDQIAQHAPELKKMKTIYIHCRSGGRAQMAALELARAGVTQLVCVAGSGMPDWEQAGFPVEK